MKREFALGEGLVGQVHLRKERILLTNVPKEYVKIGSGLGEATPINLIILPVLFEKEIKAVIELASFEPFSETHLDFLGAADGKYRYRIEYDRNKLRTEQLLEQSHIAGRRAEKNQRRAAGQSAPAGEAKRRSGSERTRKWKKPENRWKKKQSSLRLLPNTNRSSLRTCRMSCARHLTPCLILAQQLFENHEGNLTENRSAVCENHPQLRR
jgi:hypothetical protein